MAFVEALKGKQEKEVQTMFKRKYVTAVKWFYGITESKAIDAVYSLDRTSIKRIADAYKDETERAKAKAKEERKRKKYAR